MKISVSAGFLTKYKEYNILAWNPAFVIAVRIVNGIGYSCCSVCMSTWMSNMLPKDKIGFGMGLYGTMNALAMAIAPAIGVSIQFIHDKGEPALPEQEENVNIAYFYPVLAITAPLGLVVYWISRNKVA